jgi:fibronectin type 3 domain-containing protein
MELKAEKAALEKTESKRKEMRNASRLTIILAALALMIMGIGCGGKNSPAMPGTDAGKSTVNDESTAADAKADPLGNPVADLNDSTSTLMDESTDLSGTPITDSDGASSAKSDRDASPDANAVPSRIPVIQNAFSSTVNDENVTVPERKGNSLEIWSDPVTAYSWSNGWSQDNSGGPYWWYLEPLGCFGAGSYSFRMGGSNWADYGNNEVDYLYSPGFYVPANYTNVQLWFYTRYRTELNWDYCKVWFYDGSNWTVLDTYHGINWGSPSNWPSKSLTLPSPGSSTKVYGFCFVFTSDFSNTDTGWQVDYISVTGDPPGGTPPAPPTNVQASDGTYSDKIVISWDHPGASSYKVYRATSSSGPWNNMIAWPYYSPFNDTTVPDTNTYWYRVSAVDSSGQESDLSYPPNSGYKKTALAPPTNVQATDGTYSDKIVISWDHPGASSYKVYRATSSSGPWNNMIAWPYNSPFNDTTVPDTNTYWYRVSAVNSSGQESDLSNTDSGYKVLAPPTNLQASDGTYSDKIVISWTYSTGASYYEVYRATSSSGPWNNVVGYPSSSPLNDTTVPDTNTYWYRVSAVNSSGQESGLSNIDSGYKNQPYQVLWSDSVTSISWSKGWSQYNAAGPYWWYLESYGYYGSGTYSFRMGASNGGNYGNGEADSLYSHTFYVPANSTKVKLKFVSRYKTESDCDKCYVEYYNGSTWKTLAIYSGISSGYPNWFWNSYSLDLPGSSGKNYRLRFRFTSNGSYTDYGWQVDNVVVSRGG